MRNLTLAIIALVAVGCGSNTTTKDMSVPADLTVGPDIAMRMPNGVVCGAASCAVGQDCCVSFANNMATGATCVASSAQCQGATLACDGPEDCNMNATDACCATLMTKGIGTDAGPMATGGSSMCGQCSASLSPTGTITTRLCHVAADCKGLTFAGFAFDQCCSNSMSGGVQFCAPALVANGGGLTCK